MLKRTLRRENRDLIQQLKQAKEELEHRVEERTLELAGTNEQLNSELIRRKKTEERLSRESSVNAALAELSRDLISISSLEEISVLALDRAKRLTSSKFGYIGYIDTETGDLVAPAMTGDVLTACNVPDKNISFKNQKFSGLWGWVLENRKSLMTNRPADDPRSSEISRGHVPIDCFISVPAMIDEKLVGLMCLANRERDYNEQDLELAERVAAIYAITIQYAIAVRQKRMEEACRILEERFKSVIENIFKFVPEGLLVFTDKLDLFKKNKAFQDIVQKYSVELNYTERELAEIIIEEVKNRIINDDQREIRISMKQ